MAALPGLDTRAARTAATTGLVVGAGVLLAFVGAKGELGRPADLVLAVVAVFAAAAAVRWPDTAAWAALALVVVVPTYWAQPLPVLPLAATPAAVTGVLLLPAAIGARDRVRVTFLDGFVALYFLAAIASIGANVDGKVAALGDLAARSVVPYLAFRLLSSRPGGPRRLAIAVVAAAVPLAVIGIGESNGDGNPFFTLVRPGFEAGQWIRSQVRFGHIRAESSFGHAIAFSLFLAIVVLLVLGLAWQTRSTRARVLLGGTGVVFVTALLATGSRGGVVSLAVGALLWAATLRGGRRGLLVVAAVVALILVLTPAGAQVAQLRASVSDSGEAGEAARYRLEIAHIITDPHSFSLLGLETPPGLGAVNGAKELLGLRTIDSQYAVVYVTNGIVGLAAFALIGISVLVMTLRRRLDPLARAWTAGAAATAIALTTVALFTQMLTLFWIAVAVAATVASQPEDA